MSVYKVCTEVAWCHNRHKKIPVLFADPATQARSWIAGSLLKGIAKICSIVHSVEALAESINCCWVHLNPGVQNVSVRNVNPQQSLVQEVFNEMGW